MCGRFIAFIEFRIILAQAQHYEWCTDIVTSQRKIVLAAANKSKNDVSCTQIQNQLANKSGSISRRCYALQRDFAVRRTFSSQRRKYHVCWCDAKRADFYRARQACFMTRDCNNAQQLVSYFGKRGTMRVNLLSALDSRRWSKTQTKREIVRLQKNEM